MKDGDLKIPAVIIEAQEILEKHFMEYEDDYLDYEREDLKHVFNGFMMGYLCAKEHEKGQLQRDLKDKDCTHKFVCADSPVVSGAEICVKCRQVRAKSD